MADGVQENRYLASGLLRSLLWGGSTAAKMRDAAGSNKRADMNFCN
jgi:hypothetical protein